MKIYTVHVKPDGGSRQRPVFVKEGFNFFAFVLPGLWALYERVWLPLLLIVAFNAGMFWLLKQHMFLEQSIAFMQLGFNFLIGYQANDWLRVRLRAKGYVIADVTAADSLLRAQQRFFERFLAPAH